MQMWVMCSGPFFIFIFFTISLLFFTTKEKKRQYLFHLQTFSFYGMFFLFINSFAPLQIT